MSSFVTFFKSSLVLLLPGCARGLVLHLGKLFLPELPELFTPRNFELFSHVK